MQEFWNNLLGVLLIVFFLIIPIIRKIVTDIKKVQKKEREKQEVSVSQQRKAAQQIVKKQVIEKPTSKVHLPKRMVKPDFVYHSDLDTIKDLSHLPEHHLDTKINPHFSQNVTSDALISPNEIQKKAFFLERIEKKEHWKKIILYKELIDLPKSLH